MQLSQPLPQLNTDSKQTGGISAALPFPLLLNKTRFTSTPNTSSTLSHGNSVKMTSSSFKMISKRLIALARMAFQPFKRPWSNTAARFSGQQKLRLLLAHRKHQLEILLRPMISKKWIFHKPSSSFLMSELLPIKQSAFLMKLITN